MHHRDAWATRYLFPLATRDRGAAIELDRRAVVVTVIDRKTNRLFQKIALRVGQPHGLVRAHHAGQPLHHVRFDVTVDQEVAAQLVRLGTMRAVRRLLRLLDRVRQLDHRRRDCLDHERFGRAEAAHVDGSIGEGPPLRVRVKVVPDHSEVEIENVPTDLLSRLGHDRRCVPNKGAAVQAVARQTAAILSHCVLGHVARHSGRVVPADDPSRLDRDGGRVEPLGRSIVDQHGDIARGRGCRNDDGPLHLRMEVAVVAVGRLAAEGDWKCIAVADWRGWRERGRARAPAHKVEE